MIIGRFVKRKWMDEYNQVEKYIRGIFNKEHVIIDVGANIGLFNRLILKEKPAAKIYAIESQENTYHLLKCNNPNCAIVTLGRYQYQVS